MAATTTPCRAHWRHGTGGSGHRRVAVAHPSHRTALEFQQLVPDGRFVRENRTGFCYNPAAGTPKPARTDGPPLTNLHGSIPFLPSGAFPRRMIGCPVHSAAGACVPPPRPAAARRVPRRVSIASAVRVRTVGADRARAQGFGDDVDLTPNRTSSVVSTCRRRALLELDSNLAACHWHDRRQAIISSITVAREAHTAGFGQRSQRFIRARGGWLLRHG